MASNDTKEKKIKKKKAPKKLPNAVGRPSKYKPEYCQAIVDFFTKEPYREVDIVTTGKNFEKVEPKLLPNILPSMIRFTESIGIDKSTMIRWTEKYPEFRNAYTRAKELYKDFLIQAAAAGTYNAAFSIFVAKNTTDMKDKQEIEHSGKMPWDEFFKGAPNKGNASDKKEK